jgi:hypothetical protein
VPNKPSSSIAHPASTAPAQQEIITKLHGFFIGALTAFWDSIGPSGRDALRQLNAEFVALSTDEATKRLPEFLQSFTREIEQAKRDPDLLLYGEMPAAADSLIARRDANSQVIADSVLQAHENPESISELIDALHAAHISSSQLERLTAGLSALRQPGKTWAVPCDLLLGGVEGVVWELAEARDVIHIDGEGKPRDQRNRPVRSVNGTIDPHHGLPFSDPLGHFLRGRLLSSAGQDVRHRRRPELQRQWTAYALVALRGILDETGDHQLVDALAKRITTLVQATVVDSQP